MTVLPKVLGWSAVILGAFLLYSLLLPASTPCQYNIGCYLVPHSLNHTAQLHARIAKAKAEITPVAYQYRSIVADEKVFDRKVM